MPPQALQLALFLLEEGIKIEPAIAQAIGSLLAKPDPTPEEWQALRISVATKSYADYVPATALVDELPAPPASAPTQPLSAEPPPPVVSAPAPEVVSVPAAAVWTGQAVDPHA